MADAAPQTVPFDVDAARADGIPDEAIAEHLAELTGFNLPAARNDGVPDAAIIDHLAAPIPPPPPPQTPQETSGMLGGVGKAVAQLPTQIGGGLVKAGGAVTTAAGTVLAEAPRNAEEFTRKQLGVMDRIDAGEKVPAMDDPLGYGDASPEQRAQIRSTLAGEIEKMPAPEQTAVGQAATAVKGTGEAVRGAGGGVVAYGEAAHPLTDEEKQRFSVKAVQMVGNLVPYVGAAVLGGLPAVVGLAGVQGFGEHYEAAKKAGASDEDAATAGLFGGIANAGLMTVPVGKAMEIANTLSGALKGEFLKTVVEMAKSGATLTAFGQLQTIADNVIAKSTYDPDRDLATGLGQDLGPTFLAGAILPAVGAGMGAAARRIGLSPRAPAEIADRVMSADNVDDAIKEARTAAQGTPVDVGALMATAEAEGTPDAEADQARLVALMSKIKGATVGQTGDGDFHYRVAQPDGSEITVPIKTWEPDAARAAIGAQEEEGQPAVAARGDHTITPDLGDALRDQYANLGFHVIFFENDPAIPFDGAVDPAHPNTIFLSNDPTRNAEQVAGHEATHLLANITTPDGQSLAGLLHQQVLEGMTTEGRDYATRLFGADAPSRETFPAGPEGDNAHADAVTNFLVKELSADIGGEAPKFQTFLPRVIDAIQQRLGDNVAADILDKLLDGIKTAVDRVRAFFSGPDAAPEAKMVSQNWVTNLDDIHDTLSKMYAARFGDAVESERARIDDQRDRALRNWFVTTPEATEAPTRPIPAAEPEAAPKEIAGPSDVAKAPQAALAVFDDLQKKILTYRRWLGEMDAERRDKAQTAPQVQLLRQTEAAILGKVRGVEDRLTGTAANRLAAVRAQLDAILNPKADTPGMAKVRGAIIDARQRLGRIAPDLSVPYRAALDRGETPPPSEMPQFSPRNEYDDPERALSVQGDKEGEHFDLWDAFHGFLRAIDFAPTRQGVAQAARDFVMGRGNRTGNESAVLIDRATGDAKHVWTTGQKYFVAFSPDILSIGANRNSDAFVIHNHPNGTATSGPDFAVLSAHPGFRWIGAVNHDGAFSAIRIEPGLRSQILEQGRGAEVHRILADMHREVRNGDVYRIGKQSILSGRVPLEIWQRIDADIVNRALHNAGIAEYLTSHTLDGVPADIVADVLRAATDSIISIRDRALKGFSYVSVDRPTEPTGSDQGLERILGGTEPRAAERSGSEGRNGERQDADQAPGERGLDTAQGAVGILKSPRVRIAGAERETEQYTPEQLRAFENVGRIRVEPGIRERVQDVRQDLGMKAIEAMVDPYVSVKRVSLDAYTALRNANTTSGAFEALMEHGKLSFRGNAYDADLSGGFIHSVVDPLAGEIHRFLWWVAANRAERLTAEDRENLWSQNDIDAIKTLNRGTVPFDYTTKGGQVTHSREAIYSDSLRKLDGFAKNILDIGADGGLINRQRAGALWENAFYVPFYRLADRDAHFVGPTVSRGFVKQYAFKKLEGGAEKLNPDLLQNLTRNWAHMIDASIRNRAAKTTLDAAMRGTDPAAVERTEQQLAQMSKAAKENVVWIMDGGDKKFFEVTDPHLYAAISALDFTGFHNMFMDAMTWFKGKLTQGVTASPFFRAKLMVRDSMQAVATAPMSYNMLRNISDGMAANDFGGALMNLARAAAGQELKKLDVSQEYVSTLAGGGLMRLGSGRESGAKSVDIENGTMLNSSAAVDRFWTRIKTFAKAYNEVGGQFEDVNRLALYKRLIADGIPHDEAAFAARDLEDFTLKGAAPAVRFLTQVVPFMNAWAQGLYKLGRATNEDYRRVGIVLGATAMISIGLNAIYADDEDWKQRTEYDRNTNWWFKFGGTAYRIPKGFEIGAIATIAERGAEFFFSNEMTGRRFLNNVLSIIGTNLSMSPVPQIVRPMLDLAENANSATGNPIESEGQQGLLPEYRFHSGTTLAARMLSAAMNEGTRAIFGKQAQSLSPVQIDYLVNGYFGWLGSMISGTADDAIRQVSDEPGRPQADLWRFATGGIVADKDSPASRYVDLMYQQGQAIHEAAATYHDLIRLGRTAEAAEFFKEHQADIVKEPMVASAERLEATINAQIKLIENDTNRTGGQKRLQIMKLKAIQNRSAEALFGAK